jgi:hypothetical protein
MMTLYLTLCRVHTLQLMETILHVFSRVVSPSSRVTLPFAPLRFNIVDLPTPRPIPLRMETILHVATAADVSTQH